MGNYLILGASVLHKELALIECSRGRQSTEQWTGITPRNACVSAGGRGMMSVYGKWSAVQAVG